MSSACDSMFMEGFIVHNAFLNLVILCFGHGIVVMWVEPPVAPSNRAPQTYRHGLIPETDVGIMFRFASVRTIFSKAIRNVVHIRHAASILRSGTIFVHRDISTE